MVWVPPLNSHVDSTIFFHPYNFYELAIRNHPTFFIRFDVRVNFYNESDEHYTKPFCGFLFSKVLPIDVHSLESSIQEKFFNDQDLFPFLLNYPCIWTERRYGLKEEYLHTEDDLLSKISNYARSMLDDSGKRTIVGADVAKRVKVPADEFKSWIDWYEFQKRAIPGFANEYRNTIERPRDRADLYQEMVSLILRRTTHTSSGRELEVVTVKDSEGTKMCCICLEEFGEKGEVVRLPCSHSFHNVCIARWLRENHACPLCRHEMSVD